MAAFASALWASPVVGLSLCEGNLRQHEAEPWVVGHELAELPGFGSKLASGQHLQLIHGEGQI